MSELRRNPVTKHWTVMAPERKGRPGDFVERMDIPYAQNVCPFCPGNEALTPCELLTVRENDQWSLRVFPNRYPILRVEVEKVKRSRGFYDTVTGIGAHEVIVYTREHSKLMPDHDQALFVRYFDAIRSRMNDLSKDMRLVYLQFFQNCGYHGGATLAHPHGQLMALPMIPYSVERILDNTRAHYELHTRCLICDIIGGERADKSRIVYENSDFVAICPYAATVPFEIYVYPKVHSHDFMMISDTSLLRLGDIMTECYKRLGKILDEPDFQMILHSAPTSSATLQESFHTKIALHYHWCIEISPKISRLGGAEKGGGFFVNAVLPEESAELLREVQL